MRFFVLASVRLLCMYASSLLSSLSWTYQSISSKVKSGYSFRDSSTWGPLLIVSMDESLVSFSCTGLQNCPSRPGELKQHIWPHFIAQGMQSISLYKTLHWWTEIKCSRHFVQKNTLLLHLSSQKAWHYTGQTCPVLSLKTFLKLQTTNSLFIYLSI